MFDFGSEVYCYSGKNASFDGRKVGTRLAQELWTAGNQPGWPRGCGWQVNRQTGQGAMDSKGSSRLAQKLWTTGYQPGCPRSCRRQVISQAVPGAVDDRLSAKLAATLHAIAI